MCKAFLVLAALLAVPLGASLDGQATRPIESALVSRIDSLSVLLRRANSLADVADDNRREERRRLLAARIDTFQVGPFFVVARLGEVRLARRNFERAWARYAALVGDESTSLEGHTFIFYSKGAELRGLDSQQSSRVGTQFMISDRVRAIAQILGGVLAAGFPDDLHEWVGDFFIEEDQTRELDSAYRSLLTTRSAAVTGCYEGVLGRCWDALGLDHQDEWATAWYTASERRYFVRRRIRSNALGQGTLTSCLDDESDPACTALLVDRGAAVSIPLPPRARMTLVAHALSLGGPEAYARMVAVTEEPIKDRLARVSGISADSLIASWRDATLQSRPDVYSDTRKSGWSSLFWLLMLAGISTRSTRWRLT